MRALEKVAQEKGLIKPETLTKKASVVKKADLTPTNDLMENILKLCNGLRERGFVKEASEVEINFLQFRQAQTLYETSKETGEDQVHDAHPEGSHKLEGVDSTEAVVEDILDKHMKIKEVVEKKPTGKLSDASSVIGAVKKALGQVTAPKETEEELNKMLGDKLNQIIQPGLGYVMTALKTYGGDNFDTDTANEAAEEIKSSVASRPFTRTEFRKLQASLKKLQGTHNSGAFKTSEWFGSPDDDDPGLLNWNNHVGGVMSNLAMKINSLDSILTKLETIRNMKEQGTYVAPEPKKPEGQVSVPVVTRPKNDVVAKAYPLMQKADQFIAATQDAAPWLNDRQKRNGTTWLKKEKDAIQAIWSRANTPNASDFSQIQDLLMSRLDTLSGELDQYKQTYLTPKTPAAPGA